MASIGVVELGRNLYYLSKLCVISPRKRRPVTLSDLPLELLVQILLLVEWNEVLCARQTCHRLRDASLARPIWLSLVKLYSATVFPRPFCLEKPLDLYTARGLEHLVLRWQRSRVLLVQRQYNAVPILRRFISPEKEGDCVHLVEGGRWLLVGTNTGSVLCYDLEASDIEPITLIATPFDEDTIFATYRPTEIRLSVDMDLEAEYLKFNLGVLTQRMPESEQDPLRFFRWIQVWRVESDVDKNGVAKGLRAERLACFPEQHDNRCDAFRLHGQHVAYALVTMYEICDIRDGPCIIIVDWTSCDSASLVYPRRVIWRAISEWLALLPENKLLSRYHGHFLLFDLDDTPMTTLDPSQYRDLTRISGIANLSLRQGVISEPDFLGHSTRLSVLTPYGVMGVIIPHSSGTSRSVIQGVNLFPITYGTLDTRSACVGYDHTLLCAWPELITLQYAWPEDSPCRLVAKKPIDRTTCDGPDEGRWPDVLFDGSSGRTVLSVPEKELLLGFDDL